MSAKRPAGSLRLKLIAKPTVITGSEDATANRTPPGKKHQKDWDVGFDHGTIRPLMKVAIIKNSPNTLDKATGGYRTRPSQTSDREVSDPHPGSVSDGTHPEANETKLPRSD